MCFLSFSDHNIDVYCVHTFSDLENRNHNFNKSNDLHPNGNEDFGKSSNSITIESEIPTNSVSTTTITSSDMSSESLVQRAKSRCLLALCPPRKKFAQYLIIILVSGLIWGILWSLTRDDAVPGGHLFALTMLIAACWVFGEVIGKFRLPALLGMSSCFFKLCFLCNSTFTFS